MTRTTSARAQAGQLAERAVERRRERDSIAMAILAALPLATYLLSRSGALPKLATVALALGVAAAVLAWRRGAAVADRDVAARWAYGATGEEATAAALRALGGRVMVFHDVRVPGRRENIDHVVVGRFGVAVVETKRWSGQVVIGRHVRANGERRDEVRAQVARLSGALGRAVGAEVGAFVCIHGAGVRPAWFRRRAELDGVRYGGPDDLVRWLRRRRRTVSAAGARQLAVLVEGYELESRPER